MGVGRIKKGHPNAERITKKGMGIVMRLRRLMPSAGAQISDRELWAIISGNRKVRFSQKEFMAACMTDMQVFVFDLAKKRERDKR